MEDQSVDISALDRKEILARLDPKPKSTFDTGRLRVILKNSLQKNHYNHVYLSQLNKENLKKLYIIIFEKPGNRKFDQMRKSLANEMFLKFPKIRLGSLIWILRNEKVPNEIEYDFILRQISENDNVNNLSVTRNST